MKTVPVHTPNPEMEKSVLEHGRLLLESFHAAYEKDPVGRDTEFKRGAFSEWRRLLGTIYGRPVQQELTEKLSDISHLTIPHCGPLTDDGEGYLGFDSGAHTYIGKWPPQ